MSDKLKTISDIIAEKRRIAKSIRDEASNGDYWDKKKANEEAEEYEWDADDIEAAYKRELGNAQKMREALEAVIKVGYPHNFQREAYHIRSYCEEITTAIKMCRSALAAPPRNCDVGTAEEQAKRFYSVCKKYKLPQEDDACEASCPMLMSLNCSLSWAQMPYEPTAEGSSIVQKEARNEDTAQI